MVFRCLCMTNCWFFGAKIHILARFARNVVKWDFCSDFQTVCFFAQAWKQVEEQPLIWWLFSGGCLLLSIPFACWIHTRKPKRKRKHIMIIFFFRVGKKGHTGIYILGVHSNGFCENTFVLSLFRATKFKHGKPLEKFNSIFGGKNSNCLKTTKNR